MRKVLIGSLIVAAIGAVITLIGLPKADESFLLCGMGLIIYCTASFACAVISGTKFMNIFNWVSSDAPTGCILFPLYIFVFPIAGCILCGGGWIFALIKLFNLPQDN